MKVALVANDRFPIAAPFAGGLESFTWHLARTLRERGAQVTVFAAPGSDPDLGLEELLVHPLELGSHARVDVAMPSERIVEQTFAYLQCMQQLSRRDDLDVVHNNSLHYLPVVLADLVGAPMVTSLHTPPTPWLEPAMRLRGDRVHPVAVSHAVAALWERICSPRVIHNGVDMREWNLGEGGTDLVWMGRIVPEKAPHTAALIAHAAGRRLRIAGPRVDERYFEEQLAPVLDDDITYVGHLHPRELAVLVGSSAACLVTPAWEEPFGLVSPEAMACGTPVLALARGGVPEVVREPGGVAVDIGPTPEDTIALAVEALPRVEALDRRGVRRYVEDNFDVVTTIERYLALYEELAA